MDHEDKIDGVWHMLPCTGQSVPVKQEPDIVAEAARHQVEVDVILVVTERIVELDADLVHSKERESSEHTCHALTEHPNSAVHAVQRLWDRQSQ